MDSAPVTAGTLLRTRDAGGFLVSECTYGPSFSIPRHRHSFASISFAVKGDFHERIGSRSFDCATYDVVIKPPDERHSNQYGRAGAKCLLVEVSASRHSTLMPLTDVLMRPPLLAGREVAPLAMRAHREFIRNDDVSALALEALLLEIITATARQTTRGAEPAWLACARDYVHAHWRDRIALDDLAGAAGVHAATVVRGFRAHLQCTPADYVRRVRLHHAEQELTRGFRSIADIAMECGFYDQSHLTRVMKRATGMTPLEYQKARRN
jgi:AraC family transcriptional regulator